MSKKEFLMLLDELLELAPGTLTGSERLDALPAWDSVSVVGFLALVDERFGAAVPPHRVAECETINDLVALMGDRIVA